jgi:hypothetical protein
VAGEELVCDEEVVTRIEKEKLCASYKIRPADNRRYTQGDARGRERDKSEDIRRAPGFG